MAKKILYKVTAYHCPRCGSPTEPTKKFCDYCGRSLAIRSENHNNRKCRLLVDLGEYIYFDVIQDFTLDVHRDMLHVTTLEDSRRHFIQSVPTYVFSVTIPVTIRGYELKSMLDYGVHKIRFEHLGVDQAYETEAYLSEYKKIITSDSTGIQTIRFQNVGASRLDTAIPKDVLSGMRCPNCGAPVSSRYGACDFCAGWSEVEW